MTPKDQVELLKGQYARREIGFAKYYLELSVLERQLDKAKKGDRRAASARKKVLAAMSEGVTA